MSRGGGGGVSPATKAGSRRKRSMLLGQEERERFMVRPGPDGEARREFFQQLILTNIR